jgi:hypothetical protein
MPDLPKTADVVGNSLIFYESRYALAQCDLHTDQYHHSNTTDSAVEVLADDSEGDVGEYFRLRPDTLLIFDEGKFPERGANQIYFGRVENQRFILDDFPALKAIAAPIFAQSIDGSATRRRPTTVKNCRNSRSGSPHAAVRQLASRGCRVPREQLARFRESRSCRGCLFRHAPQKLDDGCARLLADIVRNRFHQSAACARSLPQFDA